MGIGGGAMVMRSTVRSAATYFNNLLSLSGPYFRAASLENRIIGLITGEKTKEAKGFAHKGNTQVVYVNDHYTCFA